MATMRSRLSGIARCSASPYVGLVEPAEAARLLYRLLCLVRSGSWLSADPTPSVSVGAVREESFLN